jgi:hypothetical protein
MSDAADNLDNEDPGGAVDDQDRAIDELREARRQLEDELHQLRREERQELLRDLGGRFAEMLSCQLAINADTAAIHARAVPDLARPDRLQVAELADQQRDLAEAAATCGHILQEEGTTVAFPQIVEQIGRDMNTVADRLGQLMIGPLTQAIQSEIATALGDLIEAVKRTQEQARPGEQQGGRGQQGGQPSLLPPSAELKLLRATQLRINDRTATLEQTRQGGGERAEQIGQALRQLEERQREVADMAQAMRERRTHGE